ncbi:hypothetical protein K7X08_037967 [Anisodus acutangulus]|uniref:Amino acid transporter transmembrane domain-containing protein n=1 Tax=Anisodus acutangulus TaxID=402998 RepID=A0A9Q1N121_9SOLA|nr:hypothetical protein K7X08_037967 [Anisodus acutangulus]
MDWVDIGTLGFPSSPFKAPGLETEGKPNDVKSKISKFFWHGDSAYDAWFSCASNQVAQVLLTLPYSFSQLGMLSGISFQLFYGLLGSWTAYLISILYIEYRTRKEREKVDFGNHVIQGFEVLDGLWESIGETWDWHLIALFLCLDPSFNSLLVQAIYII